MLPAHPASAIARFVCVVLLVGVLLLHAVPTADAGGDLVQASPPAGSTVGGVFGEIALEFDELSDAGPHRLDLLNPAGTPIAQQYRQEGTVLILPIDALDTPGLYTISFTVTDADGQLSSGTVVFRYATEAPPPAPLALGDESSGLDIAGYGLIGLAGVVLGFVIHLVRTRSQVRRARRGRGPDAEPSRP